MSKQQVTATTQLPDTAAAPIEWTPQFAADLDGLRNSLGFQLRRVQLAYKKHFIRVASDPTFQLNQVAAMRVIAQNPGITATALAAGLTVEAAQVTAIVNLLEQRGFLQRRKVASDGRSRSIRLTAFGRREMNRLEAITAEVEATFVGDVLSADEREQLIGLLDRLRRSRTPDLA